MTKQNQLKQGNKIVLICIDGLSWNLLQRFCEKGILPNFQRLIKTGVSGELESIRPLISPRIWATIYTGKSPRKHGVLDFYINPDSLKTEQIWEILYEKGEKIGVFNPMTAFTTQQENGFFVPGCLTPTVSAYPPELKFLTELSLKIRNVKLGFLDSVKYTFKFLRYGCRISTLFKVALSYLRFLTPSNLSNLDCLYKIKELESLLYSDVFIYCLKKYAPTFSVFYDNGIDTVSHWYWKYMEPESFDLAEDDKESIRKYGNVIRDYYIGIDEIVGRIASTVGKDATLVVVSDHGFQAWPKYKGVIKSEVAVSSLLHLLDLEDKAYGTKMWGGGLFSPKKREINLEEIEDLFKRVRFKETGEHVFKVSQTGLYIKVEINDESVSNKDQNVTLPSSSECSLGTVLNFVPELSAGHYPKGVMLISGPKIRPNLRIRDASVLDIVPTILAMKGMPIADDMDGKVLTCIFRKPVNEEDLKHITSYSKQSEDTLPIKGELSKEEEIHIKKRLKQLGYL